MNKLNPIIKDRGAKYKKEYRLILSAIKRYDRIAIFRHTTPDFDALGSQFGFATWIKDNFPDKEVLCLGDHHSNLNPRVFPDLDRVNITWFEKPFLAIMVDVANTPRISDPRYKKAKYKIRIDHHPEVEHWGNVKIIDTDFVAAAEIISNMLLNFKDYQLSKQSAEYLYKGIVGDSGGFKFHHTSEHTFAIAAELVARGLDVTAINQNMFLRQMSELELRKYVLNNYKLTEHGVAYYIVSNELQEELHIESEIGKEALGTFQNVEGINCWLSCTEDVTDPIYRWRVSVRSNTTPINEVCSHFNGGGHDNASGARLKRFEELKLLVEELDKLFIK